MCLPEVLLLPESTSDHSTLFCEAVLFHQRVLFWGEWFIKIFCKSVLVIDHRNSLLMIQLILHHFNSLNLFRICFWHIHHRVIKSYGFVAEMIRWNCRIWVIQKVRLDNHNSSLWPHRLFILCIRPSAFDFKCTWLP